MAWNPYTKENENLVAGNLKWIQKCVDVVNWLIFCTPMNSSSSVQCNKKRKTAQTKSKTKQNIEDHKFKISTSTGIMNIDFIYEFTSHNKENFFLKSCSVRIIKVCLALRVMNWLIDIFTEVNIWISNNFICLHLLWFSIGTNRSHKVVRLLYLSGHVFCASKIAFNMKGTHSER